MAAYVPTLTTRKATDMTDASRPSSAAENRPATDEELSTLREMSKGTLDERMGIEIVEASAERVVATMPVEGNTQPYGLLHGGDVARQRLLQLRHAVAGVAVQRQSAQTLA